VGFSGGKDSTLVAALVFDAVVSIPPDQRTKPVTVLCTEKVDEFSESHRAFGLPDDLLRVLKEDSEHGLSSLRN
jgi:tRNA(Ile)-lysidine synthase TilS/MesJ